ncbi:hypothetical protein NDU88_001174 [Pleurodeles waltl]|uniref:Uncharacterized protein n=1 Tax=Pleurodeles waltl TaxID=8319 RepID=A0AAV7R9H2_PLEWA|nr:hypothetical protein NDU88_001174 [Pleurodeles waltl]
MLLSRHFRAGGGGTRGGQRGEAACECSSPREEPPTQPALRASLRSPPDLEAREPAPLRSSWAASVGSRRGRSSPPLPATLSKLLEVGAPPRLPQSARGAQGTRAHSGSARRIISSQQASLRPKARGNSKLAAAADKLSRFPRQKGLMCLKLRGLIFDQFHFWPEGGSGALRQRRVALASAHHLRQAARVRPRQQ